MNLRKDSKRLFFLFFFMLSLFLPLVEAFCFQASLSNREKSIVKYDVSYLEEYNIPIRNIDSKRQSLDDLISKIRDREEASIESKKEVPPIDIVYAKMNFTESYYEERFDLRIAIKGDLEHYALLNQTLFYFYTEETKAKLPFSLKYNFSNNLWDFQYGHYNYSQDDKGKNLFQYHDVKNKKYNWTELHLRAIPNYECFGREFNIRNAYFMLYTYKGEYVYLEIIPQKFQFFIDFSSLLIPALVLFTIAFIVFLIILIRKNILFRKNGKLRRLFIKRFNVKRGKNGRKHSGKKKR